MIIKSLVLAAAVYSASVPFYTPTIKECNQLYQIADQIYRTHADKDFDVFAEMLGKAWIDNHKQQALEKAAKLHLPQARPEDVWELPYANDWLGCVFLQTPDAAIFGKAHFRTYEQHPTLLGWMEQNKELLGSTPELKEFKQTLENLPAIAGHCEEIVRRQPPAGSLEV